MGVYSYWEEDSRELFDYLRDDFSEENVRLFLQSIWLGDNLSVFYKGDFSKSVYVHGNPEETYGKQEREFIERVANVIVFSGYKKQFKNQNITCRIVAADLRTTGNPVYNGLEFMKIFGKAMRNFNIYVLVMSEYVYLGCSVLDKTGDDCYISFPLKESMDWDSFADTMMYLNDKDFLTFYYEFLSTLKDIKNFYILEEDNALDDDSEDEPYLERYNYRSIVRRDRDIDVSEYEHEISYFKNLLSFIKPNAVNPLELLFGAENAEKSAEQLEGKFQERKDESRTETPDKTSLIDMLDDPVELIRFLKEKESNK